MECSVIERSSFDGQESALTIPEMVVRAAITMRNVLAFLVLPGYVFQIIIMQSKIEMPITRIPAML